MSNDLILWGIVVAYIVFIFLKGVSKARMIGNTDDFLVAGRNIGWFFLFCTMGATVVGGGASIGAIGRTYEWGLLMLVVSTGWYLHFIFSGLVVAPHFRRARLYTVAGYFGHRFGEKPRFVILLLSILFSVFIVAAQIAAFGSVLSAIMPQFADTAQLLTLAILIGGAIVVIYSTAGGLLAVIHTDLYQFIILMVGFFLTLAFCIPDIVKSYDRPSGQFIPIRFSMVDLQDPGKLAEKLKRGDDDVSRYLGNNLSSETKNMLEHYEQGELPSSDLQHSIIEDLNAIVSDPERTLDPGIFSNVKLAAATKELMSQDQQGTDLCRLKLSLIQDAYPNEIKRNRSIPGWFFRPAGDKGWLFLVTTFLAFLLGETFAPGYATRYCIGKDIRQTRVGIAGAGFFLALVFPAILFFIALFARIHYPAIDPQQALAVVVKRLHSPVVGGMVIGALMMAVMSSADSALNSSTAIFVKDLFEHQLGWKGRDDRKMLSLARRCTALLGCAAILIAVAWPDIIGLLLFTYHVWAPAVILPVCIGVLSKKRSPGLTRNIFITMVASTALTLSYKFILFMNSKGWWAPLGEGSYAILEEFDPSVFGVVVSCVVFLILSLASRLRGTAAIPGSRMEESS
ncbi:MAG: sodium:solute symporter family protein [Acidobacteria bacterium]|nr:sodium:solute symporter family protein [Acidobacteriota bacterium]